jgi:glycosyltransferase involved in cell wall biosynthesis
MRVTVVDPPAYTPPYDHALCSALASQGLEVELATSRFRHGDPPPVDGFHRNECFYRFGVGNAVTKAAQHPFDMLRLARRLRRDRTDVVHFQWLPLPPLDRRLAGWFPRPRVMTAHDLLPREASDRWRRDAQRLLQSIEAVVVHSNHGRDRLVGDIGVAPEKVRVVPHGAFDYLTRLEDEQPIDPAVGELDGRRVVLCFGLVRPHKGVDTLVEVFAATPEDAVLLIVGRPLMPIEPLLRRAREHGVADRVRLVPRFVAEQEIPAYFRRADLVVLPYREVEQSGVLFTALAFASPLLVTAVGGFPEVAEHGAARVVPPGDTAALRHALVELLDDDSARSALSDAARRAAAGPYSWQRAAELTEDLYRELAGNRS